MSEPSASGEELKRYCAVALEVASEAADLVMTGFKGPLEIRTKEHAELFTVFDLRSEELLRQRLAELTPHIPVVGEERGGTPAELTWYVDPIDGTTNYVSGHPWFAVSVGLVWGEQPLAGAVVAPALGARWWGYVGGAAFKNGQACHVTQNDKLADALVTTGFPTRKGAPSVRQVDNHARVVAAARDIRRCGSAAIELCGVAEGIYDLYWMRRLNYWDTAAGAAIVLAAGGEWLRHRAGEDLQDIASNGRVTAEFLELLKP